MDSLIVETIVPAKAADVYKDWLSSEGHSNFTGGEAHIKPEVGSKHDAWDGYIWGEILELKQGSRIVMSWTTSEFPEESEPSKVEITFEDHEQGCKIVLSQNNIPQGQGNQYKLGWNDHYFQPMIDHYSK